MIEKTKVARPQESPFSHGRTNAKAILISGPLSSRAERGIFTGEKDLSAFGLGMTGPPHAEEWPA